MTVAQAIVHPTATVNILAEITAGLWARAWVVDGTYTNSYKVDLRFTDGNGKTNSHTITAVSWNRSTALTAQSSLYRSAAPDNFGSKPWPPFGAERAGSNYTFSSASTAIPAGYRWNNNGANP